MQVNKPNRWRWGVIAAIAMTLLSLFPQFYLWCQRGTQWNGNQAFFYTDETAYAAYVNALIQGRPRRNDPFTGRDDSPTAPQTESLFSIQFVPAYLVALPARALNLSTATAFILVSPIVAFATALALFWLITLVTNNDRAAAALVPFVLCLGILMSGNGVVRAFLGQVTTYVYFPFLRRFSPAVVFPCFVLFFCFVWQSLMAPTSRRRTSFVFAAAAAFIFCLYGYFYLWTAALAWLGLVTILWAVARPPDWHNSLRRLALLAAILFVAFIPYLLLLARRAPTIDLVQALVRTRSPDLWRSIEVIALIITAALLLAIFLRRLSRDPRLLFTLAFALLPFVLFNQQIITGRSLQPMHYEQFIASYTTLIALGLTLVLLGLDKIKSRRVGWILPTIAVLSFVWGMGETWIATRRFAQANIVRDEARLVALRLTELAQTEGIAASKSKVVFAPDFARGDSLPMEAPQAILWAPHMFVFSGVTVAENKERFFQFLYYSGVDAGEFVRNYQNKGFAHYAIFGWERANPNLTADYRPITAAELSAEAQSYADYVANFDALHSQQPTLSYLVLQPEQPIDLTNLDRWYVRDEGQAVGRYVLYHLTLRQN
jgi:hypothetical protein